MQNCNLKTKWTAFWQVKAPAKWEFIAAGVICAVCFFLFAHDDILETANHSWLFLESISSGHFLEFYERTLAHQNDFYYVNAAHYNVFVYAVFGVWLLPVYAVCKLFSLAPNEFFLMFWCKIVSGAFAAGCAVLTAKLAARLGAEKGSAQYAGLAVLLSPIVLFAAFSMGQYDSLCLFFILLALMSYFDKHYAQFAFIMGFAVVCKFFALLVLIPLLLLAEKRILRLLQYGLISLWLAVPTGLLFHGRDGDMGFFTKLVTARVFSATVPGGIAAIPLFLTGFAMLCAACYFYHPKTDKQHIDAALYTCLAVFCLLFLFVLWHPQWLVLLVPFMVLTTLRAENKAPWFYISVIFCFGFFVLTYGLFEGQLEVNLLNLGIFGVAGGFSSAAGAQQTLAFYFALLPYVQQLAPMFFAAPLMLSLLGKFPLHGAPLSDRLGADTAFAPSLRGGVWGVCCIAFGGFFLLPVAFQWLKCVVQ